MSFANLIKASVFDIPTVELYPKMSLLRFDSFTVSKSVTAMVPTPHLTSDIAATAPTPPRP